MYAANYGTMGAPNEPLESSRRPDSSSDMHAKEESHPAALDGAPSLHEESFPEHVKMVSLSRIDHSFVCQAIGATTLDESHSLLHTRSFWWPPKGLPDGK